MAPEQKNQKRAPALPLEVSVGAFPFELTDRKEESRYLVWIRNHSNYMAVRGFVDYFRSVGVLLRGIILNFLIFLPALLLISVALAYSHHWMLGHPFRLTLTTLAICVATILLFPILAQLFKIYSYRRSLQTGSESSVKLRDASEKIFGRLLILIIAVALLESLPWILEFIREYLQKEKLGWQGGLSAVLATLAFLSGSGKYISNLGGAKKKLAMGSIGVLGILLPVIVILYATDYLLYGVSPSPYVLLFPILGIALYVVAIFLAVLMGSLLRVFNGRELAVALGLLILALIVLIGSSIYLAGKAQAERKDIKNAIVDLLEPINKLAEGIREVGVIEGVETDLEQLFHDFQAANRDLGAFQDELSEQASPEFAHPPPKFNCESFPNCLRKRLQELGRHIEWENFQKYWGIEQKAWRDYKDEVSMVMPLVSFLIELKTEPEYRLEAPREKLAKHARRKFENSRPIPSIEKVVSDALLARAISENTFVDTARESRDKILNQGLDQLTSDQLDYLTQATGPFADDLILKWAYGNYAGLERDETYKREFRSKLTASSIDTTAIFLGLLAILIWLSSWLSVDINLTSIHGLYRDRLAAAFLIGKDNKGDVDVEDDLDLHHICQYEQKSVAPYHLINVALNLQASKELRIRDRQSDFFIFSKRFIGGERTGYCRSELMEQVFPQMSLATAMAISAAAAAPNMGRGTSPLLVALMTILNIRLGYWLPNPGLLEESNNLSRWGLLQRRFRRNTDPGGFDFRQVFATEKKDIRQRWQQLYEQDSQPRAFDNQYDAPSVRHGLVGLGFSGGGIRSAAINLGITQALHKHGIFDHVDYMSTVSGGGYLGSSISALMRSRQAHFAKERATAQGVGHLSDIAGKVIRISGDEIGGRTVTIEEAETAAQRDFQFTQFDSLSVKKGDSVKVGQKLVRAHDSIGDRFRWRVRPVAFLKEMVSNLDETHRWVNLSDGGHIENLATVELLRRRCKYIIIGDGEADPNLNFGGMATLMRTAYLDLGIEIDINLDAVRLRQEHESKDKPAVSLEHWAAGTILYPKNSENDEAEQGYLLYLKSSYTGDENEIIREYRNRNPKFPHQTTADQFFDEGQFEAYRALGQHIAERAIYGLHGTDQDSRGPRSNPNGDAKSYAELDKWFRHLVEVSQARPRSPQV